MSIQSLGLILKSSTSISIRDINGVEINSIPEVSNFKIRLTDCFQTISISLDSNVGDVSNSITASLLITSSHGSIASTHQLTVQQDSTTASQFNVTTQPNCDILLNRTDLSSVENDFTITYSFTAEYNGQQVSTQQQHIFTLVSLPRITSITNNFNPGSKTLVDHQGDEINLPNDSSFYLKIEDYLPEITLELETSLPGSISFANHYDLDSTIQSPVSTATFDDTMQWSTVDRKIWTGTFQNRTLKLLFQNDSFIPSDNEIVFSYTGQGIVFIV